MRFDKETRAKIHDARWGQVTIPWPAGAPRPEKGGVYRVQALEDREKAEGRLRDSPPRHRDVVAQMHLRRYGTYPDGYKPPKPKLSRPTKDDPCIEVLGVTILKRGWEVAVIVHEDPDPIHHTGLKTKVPAGLNPLNPEEWVPTELEPEEMRKRPSRAEREDAEDALRIEHKASVEAMGDSAEISRLERTVADQRRRGKPSALQQAALVRARRRVEQVAEAA